MDTVDHNEILNHCRIHQFLNKANEKLHGIFRNRWFIYKNLINPGGVDNQWNDDGIHGAELLQLKFSNLPSPMTNVIKNQKLDLWDVTLTYQAIDAVSKRIKVFGVPFDIIEEEMIKELKDIRNSFMHGTTKLTDDEFTLYCDKLTDIMLKGGESLVDIEKIKQNIMQVGQPKIVEDDKSKFAKLKKEANKLFKSDKLNEAIEAYNKCLDISGLTLENQALIYSNRSAAYLMLKTESSLLMAKRDAEWAIQLWPCWWRGYFRLGKTHMELQEWSEAESALIKAVALKSDSKEAQDALSDVRRENGILSRHDHINPALHPHTESVEEQTNAMIAQLGLPEDMAKKAMKLLPQTPFVNIVKGHEYRDGMGNVKQDYLMASKFYAKATADGIPEGMYNLALLYLHGKGVKCDYDLALHWLKKAANSKPLMGLMMGSGIAEAQHTLGLMYSEGTGVKQNYKEAANWYEKAVNNGFGPSANNLGIQYKKGQGVEKSLSKAYQYFKLAAERGDTPGMQNLSNCYLSGEGTGSVLPTDEDLNEGKKWLKTAASKGDILAEKHLEAVESVPKEFQKLAAISKVMNPGKVEKANPLDKEQYGKYIQEAGNKGSWTAKRQIEIWKNINAAMDAFKKKDLAQMCSCLSKAIRLDHQIAKIPELLEPIIREWGETHYKEIDVATCLVQINTKNGDLMDIIDEYLRHFHDDRYFLEMRISGHIHHKEMKVALNLSKKCLKLYPDSFRFIYIHAIVLAMHENSPKATLDAFDAFLTIAPEDHDKVPACHYRKASYYIYTKNNEKFLECFKAGLESERKQLPCFLPYDFPLKSTLEAAYQLMKKKEIVGQNRAVEEVAAVTTITQLSQQPRMPQQNNKREDFLLRPKRKYLLTNHRAYFINMEDNFNNSKNTNIFTTIKPTKTPQKPSLFNLKKITLKEMDLSGEKVYNGCVLEARIIDWPFVIVGIATVIEDENGDTERVSIYNWPKVKIIEKVMRKFRMNTIISIINPYLRKGTDGQFIIRVEDPAYINFDNTLSEKRCHCCGKESELLKCAKCLMAKYCSKECQKLDWIEFNHKEICKYLKKYANVL